MEIPSPIKLDADYQSSESLMADLTQLPDASELVPPKKNVVEATKGEVKCPDCPCQQLLQKSRLQDALLVALNHRLGQILHMYERMHLQFTGQIIKLQRQHEENRIKFQLRHIMERNPLFLEFWRLFISGFLLWTNEHGSPCMLLSETGGGWALAVITPLAQAVLFLLNQDSGRLGLDVSLSRISKDWIDIKKAFPPECMGIATQSELKELLALLPATCASKSVLIWDAQCVRYCCELATEFLQVWPLEPSEKEMKQLSGLRPLMQKSQTHVGREDVAAVNVVSNHPPTTLGMPITLEEWDQRLSTSWWAGLETFLKDDSIAGFTCNKTKSLMSRYPIRPGWKHTFYQGPNLDEKLSEQKLSEQKVKPLSFPTWRDLWRARTRLQEEEMRELEPHICNYSHDSAYLALDLFLGGGTSTQWRECLRKFGTERAVKQRHNVGHKKKKKSTPTSSTSNSLTLTLSPSSPSTLESSSSSSTLTSSAKRHFCDPNDQDGVEYHNHKKSRLV